MTRVLLVEDDEGLSQMLQLALTALGHEVVCALDGQSGLVAASDIAPEVVLLDVMMPGIDGFETLRQLRASSDPALALLPVVMLTARSDPMDIVAGLECGADDYVTKPVEPRVLDARMKALLRRARPASDVNHGEQNASVIAIGELRIDEAAMRVSASGRPVELTATELKLLLELAHHLGQVLTRHQLLASVWDYGYAGDSRLVDAAVQRLRAKIEPVAASPTYIQTVRGIGYRLDRP